MGASTAWALTKRGHDVTIYEQFEVGHKRGSSHGGSRIYRYSYPEALYVGMMIEAIDLWRALEADTDTKILQQTGGFDTGKGLDAHAAALDAHDLSYEVIDGDEVSARWPSITLPPGSALFQADGGVVLADRAWRAFVERAIHRGAKLVEGHRVDDVAPDRLGHDVTVVTAGGWARPLLAKVGIELDVRPTRETVAFFSMPERFPTVVDWLEPSVYALVDPVYGLKVGEHIAGTDTNADDEGDVNHDSVARLERWVADRFPDAGDLLHSETCIYTNTPDEHFVLRRHDDVVVGSPCSGHGFKFAPLIGERIADLAEG